MSLNNKIGGFWRGHEIEEYICSVWHPVSEPPMVEDGDPYGLVIVRCEDGGTDHIHWELVANPHTNHQFIKWARIKDVVLMPEEE